MAKAKNKVISGDYAGCQVSFLFGDIKIFTDDPIQGIVVDLNSVESADVLEEGDDVYRVNVAFKNGKKCLVETDEFVYKAIRRRMFEKGTEYTV